MNKIKFDEMNVSEEIKKAVSDMEFEEASPIQSQAIPCIIEGMDVIGQAQTGTGKTAAFGIPIIEMIESNNRYLQAIVLCPTRELSIQVAKEIRKLCKYKKGIKVLPVYGGQPINKQIKALKKGVQIVIGTPGRVIDHIKRGTVKLEKVKMIVLDEADEMFDMGFRDDIEFIVDKIPESRQTIFFSATMPKKIMNFAKKYQKNPKHIKTLQKELTVPNVEQYYFELRENMKTEVLSRLLDIHNPNLSIVFCNTKRRVDELTIELQKRGYFVDGIHGDLKQPQRDRVMSKFRKRNIDILVATDVAARGIDVDDVDIIFNYDIPQELEYYVHRIGRTARAGKTGKAFSFVVGKDIYKLRDIQKYTKTKVIRQDIPTLIEVKKSKINILLEKIRAELESKEFSEYENIVGVLLEEGYSSIDVASSILKLYSDENLDGEHEEIDTESLKKVDYRKKNIRLFINIGKRDGITSRHISRAITKLVNVPRKSIKKIDIYDKFSFVEVPKQYEKEMLNSLNNTRIKGRRIKVEVANPKRKRK